MNKICTNCGEEFETKRKDTKFCSSKCKMAYSRNVTRNVTDSVRNVTESQNVTDNSANNEVKATKVISAHYENVTRQWLIEQFKDEGKPPDEIASIMRAQDTYYQNQSHYFIPARMLRLRDERKN